MSRQTSAFTLTLPDGSRRTYTILESITPDDLVRISFKAYVHEKRTGTEYVSPFSRDVREALTKTNVAQRS
jgi:hypothetical protein